MAAKEPPWLVRQLRQHLSAWQSAGVEFVPVMSAEMLEQFRARLPKKPEAPPDPLAGRRQSLQLLSREVASCEACFGLISTRTQPVFGEGPLDAELCVVGDAPMEDDDRTGRPFAGDIGDLLTRMLAAIGFARTDVYFCNIVKCLTPNRDPLEEEIANCSSYLDRQLGVVSPKAILCLGKAGSMAVLGIADQDAKIRGVIHKRGEIPVVGTYHPAQVHANPDQFRKGCWADLQLLQSVFKNQS